MQPCIFHFNMNWRPAGEANLLLGIYVLFSMKEVTHTVGCSLGITTTIINAVVNQLAIIFLASMACKDERIQNLQN